MSVYSGSFKTIQDNETITVQIEDGKTESNDVLHELTFSAMPVMITVTSEDGIFSPIKTKAATIEICSPTPYWDLYSSKWDDTKVMITKSTAGDVFFGYVTPTLYNQEYKSDADIITLECVDPLASLKSIKYFQEDGEVKGKKTLKQILTKIFKKISVQNVYLQNTIIPADSDRKTIESFILDDNNFYDDDDEETSWTCWEVISQISKFMGLTCTMPKYNQVFFYDITSYKVYDGSSWFQNDNFTFLNTNTGGIQSYTVMPRDFNIVKENIFGSDCNISLGEVYKKIVVSANTKVPDKEEDSDGDSDNLYAADGIISKYVNYLNGKTYAIDNAVYVKVLKLKNWEQYLYSHFNCQLEDDLQLLENPYSPGDLVTRDYGRLNWMNALMRTSGHFHWCHDLYGALLKSMVIDYTQDVKGEFTDYLALGFGFIGGEMYPDTGSNYSNKQYNYWTKMNEVYQNMEGKYDLLRYTSKKNRTFQNEDLDDDQVCYYILFNGTCRLTAIPANGLLRNSGSDLTDTNFPPIWDENHLYWEDKIKDKFNEGDGGSVWYKFSDDGRLKRQVIQEILSQINNNLRDFERLYNQLMIAEGYGSYILGYKLKIGDKYWDYQTNTWTTEETVSYMKIGEYEILAEGDMSITNNVNFAEGIEESGWAIPVKNSDNLSGNVEFTFVNPRFPVPLKDVMINHYREAFLPYALLIRDFKIDYLKCLDYGYWWKEEEDYTEETEDKSTKDNAYYYEIDDNFSQDSEEWDLKINTQNLEKDDSQSSVLYNNGENVGYLQKVLNACSSDSDMKLAEEWILDKLGRHYRSPKKIINMTINDYIDVRRPVYYQTATHMKCAVESESWNVRSGENTITIREIE